MAGDEGINAEYRYVVDIDPELAQEDKPGRAIILRELACEEFENLALGIGPDVKNPGWELVQRGLRRSIISDRGTDVTQAELTGPLLNRRFRTKQLALLRTAWEQIHGMGTAEAEALKKMRAVVG